MDPEIAIQGKVTGVIIPPPEIRAVVDKTAQFVGKNGKTFEHRILESAEGKTAKFNFMRSMDPYHAYYEFKIREVEEALATGAPMPVAAVPVKPQPVVAPTPQVKMAESKVTSVAPSLISTSVKASLLNPIARILKNKNGEAPRAFEFTVPTPTGLTAEDIEVIKLTAQYTAVNGREFLAGIAAREQRNPQFDFLKPTHMLFSYFTSLVDSYMKILNPSTELLANIQRMSVFDNVLESAVLRWDHVKTEEIRKHKETSEEDEDRIAFQQIDWQDFSIVETIDFPEDELFEMPGILAFGLNDKAMAPMGAPGAPPRPPVAPPAPPGSSGARQPPPPAPPSSRMPPAPPAPPGGTVRVSEEDPDIKIVSDYKPRIAGSAGTASSSSASAVPSMLDPISGRMIPIDQMEEHMRVQLLDPKWREEQKRFQDKQKETGFAAGASIADSLKLFAKKRGDIFGQATGGENSAAAIAEEEQREQQRYEESVQWDGHTGSVNTVQSQKVNQTASFTARGLLPPLPPAPINPIGPSLTAAAVPPPYSGLVYPPVPTATAPIMPLAPAFPPSAAAVAPAPYMLAPTMAMGGYGAFPPGGDYGEPNAKKMRMEASLVSAEEYALLNPSPITVYVTVFRDAQFGGMQGSTLTLSDVAITATVKDVKDLILAQLSNALLSVAKIQLKHAASGFLKDASSLASLNLPNNSTFELSMKVRGGKK